MRRLALIATALVGLVAWLATAAGADDTHTYKIELDNAFGIVQGSEVRIAGVNQGTVTDQDINAAKRALLTVELSGPLSELGEQTTCTSEPQSLIAEYFIDCQPKGPPLADGATIPVEQTQTTVQPDLVANTLRDPYKRRLQLLINEFGTALAGNPENLNAAIRRGAPALRELERALRILADQNTLIRDLNVDSDEIIGRLAERREDVVRFVREARDTAAASAAERPALSRDFDLLDDFLAELRPTLAELDRLARQQTPLLADLRASGPGLARLSANLPAFNEASVVSLDSLGEAGQVGERALRKGAGTIEALGDSAPNAKPVAETLADFLRDLDDPRRAVEIDARARKDTGRRNAEPGQPDTMGYTGLEGLLNYVYYQAGSLNQFDAVSHLLHFSLYEVDTGPCGSASTGRDPETGEPGVPALDGDTTTDIREAHTCVSWLGPNQPGISEDLGLPRYDNSVCPEGTEPEKAREELCDPEISTDSAVRNRVSSGGLGGLLGSGGDDEAKRPGIPEAGGPPLPKLDPKQLGDVTKGLEDLLGLPRDGAIPDVKRRIDDPLGTLGLRSKKDGRPTPSVTDSLLNFLFAN